MRILYLEDDPSDVELTTETLRAEWPDCDIRPVASRDTYRQALEEGSYELILSDFNLIGFNGLDALQHARAISPHVPFVFFSGTIGEDRAVEAMRSGAADYVIKDRPKRLVGAIRRALENARLQHEREAARDQLLRVQRLENIGMLAAGIAHDFSNVLAPVLLAVPLLRGTNPDPAQEKILLNIEKSVERGAGLVRQILGFAQGVTGEPHLIHPRSLLRDLLVVVRQTFPAAIQVEDDIASELWPLKVNPTQLHQVLLNLCVNARDAMPNGGVLRLKAANVELDELSAAGLRGMRPGAYLRFEVGDSGTGIPPELLERIWEPFFTTKEKGRGTGLGLPTVRSIIDNYQGAIKVHSQAGRGTTFQVYLPAQPGHAAAETASATPAMLRGQGELVLVVDDDDNVRDIVTTMLTRHNYRVLAAANGTEAVALFAPRSLEVRAVITDLAMPQLDGYALAQIVHQLNPTTRILTMSGVSGARERLQQSTCDGPFLAKPFTSETLLQALQTALAGNANQAATVA